MHINSVAALSRRRRIDSLPLYQKEKPSRKANQTVNIIPELIHPGGTDHT